MHNELFGIFQASVTGARNARLTVHKTSQEINTLSQRYTYKTTSLRLFHQLVPCNVKSLEEEYRIWSS